MLCYADKGCYPWLVQLFLICRIQRNSFLNWKMWNNSSILWFYFFLHSRMPGTDITISTNPLSEGYQKSERTTNITSEFLCCQNSRDNIILRSLSCHVGSTSAMPFITLTWNFTKLYVFSHSQTNVHLLFYFMGASQLRGRVILFLKCCLWPQFCLMQTSFVLRPIFCMYRFCICIRAVKIIAYII
jgi:hypothetical protein